ncbi:MAG: peroxidase-related enzyme [Pseudohongiellaceae bacterium]
MSHSAISRFEIPALELLPSDIRQRILEVEEKAGFIPNIFLALAHRPAEFRAFFSYHDALMEKAGGLSKAEREMIVVATSGINQCIYCVVAHGAILRIREKNPLIADQIATNFSKAEITNRQAIMLNFAVKVSQNAQEIEDADFTELRENGFTDEEIWDIGSIAALFALSNRLANMADIRPNSEFYSMGRSEIGE